MKEFKTESKRLLDLMANSIYTNNEIFLRELISNASDALDKKHIISLTNSEVQFENPQIEIIVDKENRTIKLIDNGIGMNYQDLEDHLGTIARSGSFNFKQENNEKQVNDIIGQFGVGFYSGFMVADKIEVNTLKYDSSQAYRWICQDLEGYDIEESSKASVGTEITLYIKKSSKEKNYDQFLDAYFIERLVKKYSDFIRYPIVMEKEVSDLKDGKEIKSIEKQTLNSMVPLWKKDKKDIKSEDYEQFYNTTYFDFQKPLKTIHYKIEGNTSYTALLYIPSVRSNNFYSNDYKFGLSLYSKGVFIKDEAKELCSEHFRFIKGVVDSDDLNLNISREILQQDHQMNQLKKSIDKKIKTTLKNMLEKDKAEYDKFFENFGMQLKYGIYQNFGANKDELIDLILFKTSKSDEYISLSKYLENMQDKQEDIYYVSGSSLNDILNLPQLESFKKKDLEVLYLTETVDEFMIQVLNDYQGKKFKSILSAEIDVENEQEKQELEKQNLDFKDIVEKIKEILKDKVSDVRLSKRLVSYPCGLVSSDNISIEMEKILKAMDQDNVHANKVLEINPDHEILKALKENNDKGVIVDDYVNILYDQALLLAGIKLNDTKAYIENINKLLKQTLQK